MGKFDHLSDSEKRAKIQELKAQISEAEGDYNFNKAMQLGLKLVLNGTYGAFCHPAFTVSNTNIANSITSLAREVINYMLDRIEDYFYNDWGNDKDVHALLGHCYITERDGGYYIHRPDGMLMDEWPRKDDDDTKGVDKVMNYYYLLHEDIVEKDKDTIEWEGKEYNVIHKLHVHDFSTVKPLPTGYKIKPDTKTKDFDKSRGVREVPIIIYGDTDSLYISFTALAKCVGYTGDMLKFIHHMNGAFVKHLFKEMLEDYAKPYGVKNIHDFELETVNASGLHMQKKMYINNVVWEDGIGYENLTHFYPKGIAIVRSSTPLFVRENINEFIKYIFSNTDNLNIREVLKILKKIKKQYMLADLEDISNTTSCSNYQDKVIDDQGNLEFVKGAHFSVKAAALHNYLLNKNSEYKTRYDLIRSGKVKFYYCNHPMGDKFAYVRSFHPTEITTKEGLTVDYDLQFEKTFLAICNRFLEPIGLPTVNKRLSVLNSIFSIGEKKPKKEKVIEDVDFEELNNDDDDDMFDDMFDESWNTEEADNEEEINDAFDDFNVGVSGETIYEEKTKDINEEVVTEITTEEDDGFWD